MAKRINSRAKGQRGELELAELLRSHGIGARRGQQFSGGTDSPDVVHDLGGLFHIECKRVERGSLYDWMAQASRDAGGGRIPLVCHRRSRGQWLAILPLEELLKLLPFLPDQPPSAGC